MCPSKIDDNRNKVKNNLMFLICWLIQRLKHFYLDLRNNLSNKAICEFENALKEKKGENETKLEHLLNGDI